MSDLDPIELEFLMNTPELLADLQAASKGMKDFDSVVANAQKKFDDYNKTKTEAGKPNPNSNKIVGDLVQELAAVAGLDSGLKGKIATQAAEVAATNASTIAQSLYGVVVGKSTGALKLFRIALASTGIGLVIILIASLVANWDKITASVKKSNPELSKFGDKLDKLKSFIMGFLNAYLSLVNTVISTLGKLATFDFSGAINNARNAGKRAGEAYNAGYNEQENKNLVNKNREKVKAALEKYNRDTELIEKRTGKIQYDRRAKAAAAEASLYDKGTKEYNEKLHDRNVVLAEKAKEAEDIQKRASDKASKLAEKQRKKEEAEAKKAENSARALYEKKTKFIQNYYDDLAELNHSRTSDSTEEAKIRSKYDDKISAAEKLGLKEYAQKYAALRDEFVADAKYKDETKDLLKNLDNQKELYAAFEAYKTRIGEEEAAKRIGVNLSEFQNYGEVLDSYISELENKKDKTFQESERLKSLKERRTDVTNNQNSQETEKYAKAIEATLTYEEKKKQIENSFREQRLILEKNLSGSLLQEKLNLLEKQKQAALTSASDEALQNSEAFKRLGDFTLQMHRKQLQQRLEALKTYLETAKNLSPEQKFKIEKEISDTENLIGKSQLHTRINQLNERKLQLIKLQNEALEKQDRSYLDIAAQIDQTNRELSAAPYDEIANKAEDISNIFGDLAGAIGDSNEGLSDTLAAIGTIAGAVADVAGGIAESILSGNPLKMIGGIVKGISKIFSLQKAARESERKAAEEMKKRQDEIFQSGLDYNAMLRKRIQDETKLNDLYQSRVEAIKEEMAAHGKNKDSILRDYQAIFNRLLGLQTTVGQTTEKYGGFLGFGRKTRTVDIQKSIGSILGLDANSKITDEILDRLDELNAKQPLTGDAKNAYEQLKKLRDEYGSIADAQFELEKQLKDAITGTTAQSLADSIKEGILSGKKSFADFADDIENFLRQGIIAGMSAKVIEPQIQKLQDELANYLGDGVLTSDEKKAFQEMYLKIAKEADEYIKLINESGINVIGSTSSANSLQGAIKGASQESINILSGQMGGLRLNVSEIKNIIKNGAAQQMETTSKMLEVQMNIEHNTRRTADNTDKLPSMETSLKNIEKAVTGSGGTLNSIGIKN